ncbi:meteorin-like protein [Ischnura elegans]|uniref:meteorin-like protein n=1 Tax=Ischnura elegans TaxID=197161 RepID=UPI001ED891A9|nr:meteorin-like protein [Ischnura elegans]
MQREAEERPSACCACVSRVGGGAGRPLERWCLRRRRLQQKPNPPRHATLLDSRESIWTFRRPPVDRLPRLWICGEDGDEGGGAEQATGGPASPCAGRTTLHWSRSGEHSAEDTSGLSVDRGGLSVGGVVRRTRRRWCWFGASGSVVLISLFWLLVLVCGASGSIMGDGCDWSGSGLMAESEVVRDGGGVGVRPVYLRCSQGAVSWAYPRGALRVLLRLAGGEGDFRGCVRVGRTWRGARLFLEGVRALHPLFPEEGQARGSGVRCFQSRRGQAALYVEATPGGQSPRGRTVASFEYHLQPLPSGAKTFDPSEECRPCTMEEMTHAFCSSDLVTRGSIRSVESRDDPDTSELKVRVTKLIRRTRAPPPALEGDPALDEDEIHEEQQQQPRDKGGAGWWSGAAADRGASVTLHVPAHCGARHGAGEFVFMAQRKLGQLRLRCAPRLEDWAELARRANRLAASPCVLQA